MSVSDFLSDLQKNRDETYEKGELNGEFALNFAADALLPTDLVYTINKVARGEEVTGEDIALSVVDGVSTALGAVSFGLGKVAGSGVKAAIKGGTTAAKIAAKTTGVASPVVGAAGSIAVPFLYDGGGNGAKDGTNDTIPSENVTNPQTITVNVVKEPQSQPDKTDTQGLNDVLLTWLLAAGMNRDANQNRTSNTEKTNTKTQMPEYLPLVLIAAATVVFVVLLTRR